MEWYEKGSGKVRVLMLGISAGQGGTSEDYKLIAAAPHSGVEVGDDNNGFRNRFAKESEGT